jgi:polyhydroxyalkanoate synthesis regulator phasin
MRSILVIGTLAAIMGLLLGSTVLSSGAAGAQEISNTSADPADRDARQADRIRAALDDLVEEGTISAEQADAVAAHLAGRWDFPGRRHLRIHAGLDVAATTIGISEADLVQELRTGQSVAEVAEANGVEPQAVIDALVAEIDARVDEAVAEGNLEAERADAIKANAVEKATAFVNGELRFRRGPRLVDPAA